MLNKKIGVTIQLAKTNESYHSYNDLNLIITNACSISAPEINSDYISVKGRNGVLDISEALTGSVTYKSRHIAVNLAGVDEDDDWDYNISELRNLFDGQIVKLIFDNDSAYYWYGRCQLIDFSREGSIGRFTLDIPYADPYKYNVQAFNEDWLWDPFNFETGYVTDATSHTITGHTEITLPSGTMPVSPTIIVTNIKGKLTVQKYGESRVIDLSLGENKVYAITINDTSESILIFEGKGTFSINYRGGSL